LLYYLTAVDSGIFVLFLPERDCRQSVCLSSVCLLPIRLSVVCNVGAPYSGGWTFIVGNISSPLCALVCLPCKILRRSSQGNPSIKGDVKRKRGRKIQRFWTCRRLCLI